MVSYKQTGHIAKRHRLQDKQTLINLIPRENGKAEAVQSHS